MRRETTTWHLEMLSPSQFKPARLKSDLEVCLVSLKLPGFVKYLWTSIGEQWSWFSRLSWSDDEWHDLVYRPDVAVWVGYVGGTPIGYIELRRDDNDVEIAFFGVLPEFIGQGYGGHLLNVAITKSWDMGAARVWVHTCDADGPHALTNYTARGFEQFDVRVEDEEVPAEALPTSRRRRHLVVFGGLPGVGKTTLSRAVADRTGGFWLRLDTAEVALLRSGIPPSDVVGIGAHAALEAIAGANLELAHTVVIDAVNAVEAARRMWRELAERSGATLSFVEVVCSDVDDHRRRIESREADIEGHSLPTWDDILQRDYEPWTEARLTVDTAGLTGVVVLEILRYLDRP